MSELETFAVAEQEMAWLAIRQPAIVRMLERDLAGCDTDALAAGLELTSQLLSELSSLTGVILHRVSSRELAVAGAQVASAGLDPEIARAIAAREAEFHRLRAVLRDGQA